MNAFTRASTSRRCEPAGRRATRTAPDRSRVRWHGSSAATVPARQLRNERQSASAPATSRIADPDKRGRIAASRVARALQATLPEDVEPSARNATARSDARSEPLDGRLDPASLKLALRCLSVLGVLGAGSLAGVASSLYLVNHFPLLLVLLSPLGRHIVLAVPLVDPVVLVLAVTLRRLLFYLASFHLGRALGPSGIPWLEQRAARFARFVRWLEQLFARAPRAVVFFLSGPTVSALAGIHGLRTGTFTALALASLLIRMCLLVAFGAWLREPLEAMLAFIDEYWVPGTAVLVTGIALQQWRQRSVAARSRRLEDV